MSVTTTRRTTVLTVRALRADALHRLLASDRGRCGSVEEIALLPDLASWDRVALLAAIDDLIVAGVLQDKPGPRGGLTVTPPGADR